MTWGKVGDHDDDDPRKLAVSNGALGLYWRVMPYLLRRNEALVPLGLAAGRGTPDERSALVDVGLWIPAGTEGYRLPAADWLEISCPEERRGRDQHVAAGQASAAARRARYGTAQPAAATVPITTQTEQSPNGVREDVRESVPNDDRNDVRRTSEPRLPSPESQSPLANASGAKNGANGHVVISNGTLGGYYVDACRVLGVTPDRKLIPRVGAEAKRMQQEGHSDELIRKGIEELARRNISPTNLGFIIGDLERAANGVDTARRAPPHVNPIDAQVAAMRQPSTIIEVPKT